MGRPVRTFYSGGIYHVISRGNDGEALFLDPAHFSKFLSILVAAKAQFQFKVFAYCLMSNHVHLLLQQQGQTLSKAMHSVLTRYSHWFNAVHSRNGHLFQGRFKAYVCRDDIYFRELMRYIHLNPVRARIVARPEDWRWSGHAQMFTGDGLVDRAFPLSVFGDNLKSGLETYSEFLKEESSFQPDQPEKEGIEEPITSDSVPQIDAKPVNLEQLAKVVTNVHGITLAELTGSCRLRRLTEARRDLIARALTGGIPRSAIMDFLNCSSSYLSKVASLAFS